MEIDETMLVTQYLDRGFHAIGSGKGSAYVLHELLVHHGIADKTIDCAEQIAYRLLDAAIAVAAFGLGPPVHMTVVAPSDTTEYDDIELRRVEDAVNTWRHAEAETLNAVVGGRQGVGHTGRRPLF